MSQFLLRDFLPKLGVCQPGHGRVYLKLVSKNLPHLPQKPGGHGQERWGVAVVMYLPIFRFQFHRRLYHSVANGFEVRVLGEGNPLYGPLIVDIPGGLLVLIPQVVELGDVFLLGKFVHDLVHQSRFLRFPLGTFPRNPG